MLRAWALWRARQEGWADAQRGRSRHFEEQEARLERDIEELQAPDHLLGDKKANSRLRQLAPRIAHTLLGRPGGVATGTR